MNAAITFIGGGNMTRSLVGGLIQDGYPPDRITISEPDTERRDDLQRRFGIHGRNDNTAAVRDADVVVLAVKPPAIRQVAEELAPTLQQGENGRARALVVSIAAGVRIVDLERWLGGNCPVVRTMPNTPSLVGSGATGMTANSEVSSTQHDLAESLMRAVGVTCWLPEEEMLDAVTAISGSGPAYFFLMMEALEEAGVDLGLDRKTARLLTLETATGAARMALESDESPAQLRARVTSPGGTTEQAISVLEDGQLRELMNRAATAAARRAEELGRMLGEQ